MSVLFCHDHRFVIDSNGTLCSTGQYSSEIVARYERMFGEMYIAGRDRPLDKKIESRLNRLFKAEGRFFNIPDLSNPKSLVFGNPAADALLLEAIRKVDVVVARVPSEIGNRAAELAWRLNKPVIVEVVACVWDGLMSHGSLKARLYAPIAYRRMQKIVARSEWALYVTSNFLQGRYPTRGKTVCASNVQLTKLDPETPARRAAAIAANQPPFKFGMIAAMFHNEKRVDVAIKALQLLKQKTGVPAILEVVGSGDTSGLKAYAEQLGIGDAVRFLGVLPHGDRIFEWLDTVDCYVQTSFQEGLPRATIEAMSRGAPVLASNVGGTYELVDRKFLHERGDSATLAGQMEMIQDPAIRLKASGENFNRTHDYLDSLLSERRRAFWSELKARHQIA